MATETFTLDDMRAMPLHSVKQLSPRTDPVYLEVRRVPGGWVYFHYEMDRGAVTSVFVPESWDHSVARLREEAAAVPPVAPKPQEPRPITVAELNVGDELEAIDPCVMRLTGRASLVVGKKYKVREVLNSRVMLYDEVDFAHWFIERQINTYFKRPSDG